MHSLARTVDMTLELGVLGVLKSQNHEDKIEDRERRIREYRERVKEGKPLFEGDKQCRR